MFSKCCYGSGAAKQLQITSGTHRHHHHDHDDHQHHHHDHQNHLRCHCHHHHRHYHQAAWNDLGLLGILISSPKVISSDGRTCPQLLFNLFFNFFSTFFYFFPLFFHFTCSNFLFIFILLQMWVHFISLSFCLVPGMDYVPALIFIFGFLYLSQSNKEILCYPRYGLCAGPPL